MLCCPSSLLGLNYLMYSSLMVSWRNALPSPVLLNFYIPEKYWRELTPESVLLARVFVDHCFNTKNDARLESASLPVVTAFAFHVQEAYNTLLGIMQEEEQARFLGEDGEDDAIEELEERTVKAEVVLAELLKITVQLDFSDEIGRRKVFVVASKRKTNRFIGHSF
jgi:condensin complex subunit 3